MTNQEIDISNRNKKCFQLENKDWVIPFTTCFVLKKASNLDVNACSVDVNMTMIVKIKFHGLEETHMDYLMKHVEEKLKCRFNEIETPLLTDELSGKVTRTKSMDAKDKKDMLVYTLRITKKFFTEFEYYQ